MTIKELFSRKWRWASIMICIALTYSLFRITNIPFWDNAIGNLLATILGVVFGVPIGLEINRIQQAAQTAKEEIQKATETELRIKKIKVEQEDTLKTIIEHLSDEMRDNMRSLERLEAAMDTAKHSDVDLWEWLSAISESLVTDSFHELVNFDPEHKLWRNIVASLHIAYPMMIEPLRKRIRESAKKCAYLHHHGDQTSANSELEFLYNLSRQAKQRITEAIAELDRFRLVKGYIESLPLTVP